MVVDVLGRIVATLVDEYLSAAYKTASFDASNLPSGVYFYRLNVAGRDGVPLFTDVKKMLLSK